MTPDYAALAQRLRDRADQLHEEWGEYATTRICADMDAAASALDRLAAVEGALSGLIDQLDGLCVKPRYEQSNQGHEAEVWDASADSMRHAIRSLPALATARRALEGDKS